MAQSGLSLQRVLMTLGGILGVLYLLNPGAGLFEILPDALPVVGNIDEALAATLVLACLREYGLDLTRWRRKGLPEKEAGNKPASKNER